MDEYAYRQLVPTRWHDNDIYGHVNNTIYYAAMDTVINTWMIERGSFEPSTSPVIGLVVSSSCEYSAPASFPQPLTVGLRVGRLGTTSITWETGVFVGEELIATGTFVHVYVDRASRRPAPIPEAIRLAAERELMG